MAKLNPGDKAQKSGEYCVCDKKGNKMAKVDMKKGDKLPPTQSSDYHYEG